MKKVWFIGGVGGTGKSTLGINLAKRLSCSSFFCDDVYYLVQKKLNIKKELLINAPTKEGWENPKFLGIEDWGCYGTPEELLEECYLEFFNYELPSEVVLDSGSIFFNPRELAVLEKIFQGYQKRFLIAYPDYEQWLKNRSNRITTGERMPNFLEKNVYKEVMDVYQQQFMPKGAWAIKDVVNIDCSLTGGTNYQSEENNASKWEIFNFPKDMAGKKFLEIGCNTGYFLKKASDAGADVEGVDISWQVLDKTLDSVPDAITYLTKVEDFFWNKRYDYVLCCSAFHYFKDRERIIRDISKETDHFVLELPTRDEDREDIFYQGLGDDKYFCAVPTKKLILKWLNKYFKNVEELDSTTLGGGKPRNVFKCTQ